MDSPFPRCPVKVQFVASCLLHVELNWEGKGRQFASLLFQSANEQDGHFTTNQGAHARDWRFPSNSEICVLQPRRHFPVAAEILGARSLWRIQQRSSKLSLALTLSDCLRDVSVPSSGKLKGVFLKQRRVFL